MSSVSNRIARLLRCAAMIAAASLSLASQCEAAFVSGFTGSVSLSVGGSNTANGIINYAVFQNNVSNDWLGSFGLDLSTSGGMAVPLFGSINTKDAYVYLYEIVNTDLRGLLVGLQVPISADDVLSIGYFDKRVFLDGAGNPVGKFPNQSLGSTLLGSGTTSSAPVAPSAKNATSAAPIPNQGLSGIDWSAPVLVNGYSSIVFVTSKSGPAFLPGKIVDDSGNISTGPIPGVVPEPTSFALILIGAGALVASRVRRKV